jgi:hypothetical protein
MEIVSALAKAIRDHEEGTIAAVGSIASVLVGAGLTLLIEKIKNRGRLTAEMISGRVAFTGTGLESWQQKQRRTCESVSNVQFWFRLRIFNSSPAPRTMAPGKVYLIRKKLFRRRVIGEPVLFSWPCVDGVDRSDQVVYGGTFSTVNGDGAFLSDRIGGSFRTEAAKADELRIDLISFPQSRLTIYFTIPENDHGNTEE